MSNQYDSFRSAPERKLALSGLIRRTIATTAEREQQRSKLVNAIILAQFLVTAITTAGYIGSPTALVSLVVGVLALAIYSFAFLMNRFFHRGTTALYILVIGGTLAIAAQTILLALNNEPLRAGQAALLFIAIILETGLFFTPEITLIVAFTTTIFSAFAILLGLANNHTIERHDIYLLIAFTLGLQALTSLVAWLLSQYIYETALEAQRAQDLQFAQARYEALAIQMSDHQQMLENSIGTLIQTISRAISGEYIVRAEILESELSPLADSLNLLLQRYETASQAEQARSRMDAAALPMIDAIARMTESTTPTPTSLPIMTNTPLDSVSVMLSQMQSNLNARLGRVQRLAGEVASTLNHSHEALGITSEMVQEAQRIAGVLIGISGTVVAVTRKQIGQIASMRQILLTLLPEEITRTPENEVKHGNSGSLNTDIGDLSGLAQDLGMGVTGYTGQFEAITPQTADGEEVNAVDIAPLTVPLQTMPSTADVDDHKPILALQQVNGVASKGNVTGQTIASGELLSQLVETWNQTTLIDRELGQLERMLGQMGREVGMQSKHLRTADANIAWMRSTLEAVYHNAVQLEQIAGTSGQLGGDVVPSRPLPQSPLSRGPQLTRPIPPEMRDDNYTLAELAQQAVDGLAAAPEPSGPPTLKADEDALHAPGSLRTSDLLSFSEDDDFSFFADANLSDPLDGEQEEE